MSHTLATLDISRAAYDEIAAKLRAAGYDHVFSESGLIDMNGIGLVTAVSIDLSCIVAPPAATL